MADSVTAKLGLAKFNVGTVGWGQETSDNWDDVENLYKTGSADPNVATQALFVGQLYVRTLGGDLDIYQAENTAAPSTWTAIFHSPRVFKKAISNLAVTLSGTTPTPDFSASNSFKLTLTGNTTIQNPTNVPDSGEFLIEVTQDGATPHTLAWGANFAFVQGVSPGAPPLSGRWIFRCIVNSGLSTIKVVAEDKHAGTHAFGLDFITGLIASNIIFKTAAGPTAAASTLVTHTFDFSGRTGDSLILAFAWVNTDWFVQSGGTVVETLAIQLNDVDKSQVLTLEFDIASGQLNNYQAQGFLAAAFPATNASGQKVDLELKTVSGSGTRKDLVNYGMILIDLAGVGLTT